MLEKGVDYLQRNGVPGLLCTLLSGRRIGRSEAICIYLRVPDYAPFSWLAIRPDTYLSRRCFTLTSAEPRVFCPRYYIGIGYTLLSESIRFFLSFFSFSLFSFLFFFLDDKGTDNWTRDLQPERSTRTLEFFFF